MSDGRRRPVKGFRPGKEPPQLRKQRAKQELGEASGAQERLLEIFAERSPEESRRLMRRWRIGFLAGTVVLAAAVPVVVGWSVVAGVVVGLLALVCLVIWLRLRSRREAMEAMIDMVSPR